MHTNEAFLKKLTPAQIEELKAEAVAMNANGAYAKALAEQLSRLGV